MRPTLSNRPLYDTEADAALFLEPPSWEPLYRWVDQGYNVFVSGARGSGRTSLLRQLQRRLRENDLRVSFVDAAQAAGLAHLVALVSEALIGQPRAADLVAERVERLRVLFAGSAPGGASTAVQDVVESWGQADAQVVLLDGPGAGTALYELFGRFRDELWQLELVWVVAVDDADAAVVLRPPADAFFDQRTRLGTWSAEELAALLRRRGVAQDDIPGLVADGSLSPRDALAFARDALTGDAESLVARRRRVLAAGSLSEAHAAVQEAVEDLGPTSASDPALLARLGVSRPRAQALLSDLSDARLVVSDAAQQTGRGRPRKLFRPAEDAS